MEDHKYFFGMQRVLAYFLYLLFALHIRMIFTIRTSLIKTFSLTLQVKNIV